MPKRNSPLPGAPAQKYMRPEAIVATRDRHLAEIAKIQDRRGKLAGCAKNAHTMLTRSWARASWHARVELLKASAWMLHLERLRDMWPEM
jgi:hypothetical protein